LIVAPHSSEELASLLQSANAEGKAVAPRGGGTKSEWGNPATRTDMTLSTGNLNRVVEHAWADMTVTVEAGCTVANLQATLAEHGQRLAIDPLWPERATIGGILATNDSGALRLRFGGLRDLIIGITIALPDGTLASSGGKVVKNVAGYDLPKLVTGALGTLGVITRAVFRLHPLPRFSRTLAIRPANLAEAQRVMLALQNSQLAHSAMQLRAVSKETGGELGIDLLLEGTEAGIDAQEAFVNTVAPATIGKPDVWSTREQLWPADGASIIKFTTLPSDLGSTVAGLHAASVVLQATGIGYAKLSGDLTTLRAELEAKGGSLVILTSSELDAWGSAGDALGLMRAVKRQFDPHNILNPGRFVGAI